MLSLEGADSIVSLEHLDIMYEKGLRAIGPAHYGPGTYAFGTDSTGGIGVKGRALLKKIQELGMILDVTHLCDQSFWEALEVYEGPLWASHSNCRKWVPNERQFSDDQIQVLIERKAVIGMAFDAWMMLPNWKRGYGPYIEWSRYRNNSRSYRSYMSIGWKCRSCNDWL